MSFFGVMSEAEFLAEYWQKKPLFIKGAFKNIEVPISMEEIAGLSLEEEIPSRLVLESGGSKPWELRNGPFDPDLFASLPKEKWILIINDMEKFIPELDQYIEPFRFIPRWRLDDLQVSLAEDEGNVGAHWDDYDVFLIQGEGKKRWQISYSDVSEDDYKKGVDIRLIENFNVDEEWEVEEGDLLYLPPRIGHYGVSIGRSVTWSVGFRMPKVNAILDDFTHMLIEKVDRDLRLQDPNLKPHISTGEITNDVIDNVTEIFKRYLDLNRENISHWFGQHMTLPKMNQEAIPRDIPYTKGDLITLIQEGGYLEAHPGQRFLYRLTDDAIELYLDGECYARSLDEAEWIIDLCNRGILENEQLAALLPEEESRLFILVLINEGYLLED